MALQKLGDAAPRRLLTARDATRQAGKLRPTAGPPADHPVGDALVEVHHCDFRALPVGADTARLIFTDPLYHSEHLGLYSDLGEWAARALQPGGLLVTYLGTSFLPDVIARLGQHLAYVWPCVTVFTGEKTPVHDRRVRSGDKPLLVFSNGPERPRGPPVGVIESAKEKSLHPFQQAEGVAAYFVGRLTEPADLVLDPFTGSATTAAAWAGAAARRTPTRMRSPWPEAESPTKPFGPARRSRRLRLRSFRASNPGGARAASPDAQFRGGRGSAEPWDQAAPPRGRSGGTS